MEFPIHARLTTHLQLALVAFLAVSIGAFWVSREVEPDQDGWRRAFPTLQAGEIRGLEVSTAEAGTYRFWRQGAEWAPATEGLPFSPASLENLVSAMVYLELGPELGVEASSEYGLEPPAYTVTLFYLNDRQQDLTMGAPSTDQMHDYIHMDGSVHLSRTRISQAVEQLTASTVMPPEDP